MHKQINEEVKQSIKKAGLHQYQVATELGVVESTFIRWLRSELSNEKKELIYRAINNLTK